MHSCLGRSAGLASGLHKGPAFHGQQQQRLTHMVRFPQPTEPAGCWVGEKCLSVAHRAAISCLAVILNVLPGQAMTSAVCMSAACECIKSGHSVTSS